MIVPRYWAEGRVQHREKGKQVTVRRFGWSDNNPAEAQSNAESRAQEALARLLSGEKLQRFEPKTPYNGAHGVPIREEIVDQRGETIITRNSYGALCLNTPDVFFADVDFRKTSRGGFRFGVFILLLALAIYLGGYTDSQGIRIGMKIAALILCFPIAGMIELKTHRGDRPERSALRRIKRFLIKHPEWNFRIYRTPAGLRLMATHQKFDPNDPTVTRCFSSLETDRIYSRMCRNQRCFRARVSPKPWRIGISNHLKPRPGTWPVKPEHLPKRAEWLARYEDVAINHASCRFMDSMGSGVVHESVMPTLQWHDEISGALSGRPIA